MKPTFQKNIMSSLQLYMNFSIQTDEQTSKLQNFSYGTRDRILWNIELPMWKLL